MVIQERLIAEGRTAANGNDSDAADDSVFDATEQEKQTTRDTLMACIGDMKAMLARFNHAGSHLSEYGANVLIRLRIVEQETWEVLKSLGVTPAAHATPQARKDRKQARPSTPEEILVQMRQLQQQAWDCVHLIDREQYAPAEGDKAAKHIDGAMDALWDLMKQTILGEVAGDIPTQGTPA
jgi:hypothetical protein